MTGVSSETRWTLDSYILALRGLPGLIRVVLDGADVNAQGGDYGNALQAASWRGSEEVVWLLLEKGANVNAQGGEYGNAQQAASHKGHQEIMQMLLEAGADVNAQGGEYGNALQAASVQGHQAIVLSLQKNGAGEREEIYKMKKIIHTHTQFIDARAAEPKGQLTLLC